MVDEAAEASANLAGATLPANEESGTACPFMLSFASNSQ